MDILASLNPQQHAAVILPPGPILVQAGAGTGKTRVLTLRIAYLIDQYQVDPSHILAITFTNKAANELRERLKTLLGKRNRGLTSGTFHAICTRILRAEITERIGSYTSDFTIYGADEQLQVAAEALDAATERPPMQVDAAEVLRRISHAKSRLLSPRMMLRFGSSDPLNSFVAGCYRRYQRTLARSNALDFDDLLLLTHQLFTEHPDVLERYQHRWQHILVDEYQDTDPTQHALLELLSRPAEGRVRSLFVVGDGMQSIYGFRNADYTIIKRFATDFPDAQVCNLTINYRSRQSILNAAYAVIRHSTSVPPMELQSASSLRGERCLAIIDAKDARDEATHIAQCISDLEREGRQMGQIAVLYRSRHMSRPIETELRRASIPYQVRGSTGFYDRAVIRDALAYLRVIANPADNLSLVRAATRPARGLGSQSLATLSSFAAQQGISLLDALGSPNVASLLPARAAKGAQALASLFARWRTLHKQTYPPDHLLNDVLERSGYLASLEERLEPEELTDAQYHLQELVNAAYEHTDLSSFLQEIALLTSTEEESGEEQSRVALMTIHGAKGLEWPVVFVAGLEEGTLPHERSMLTAAGIEEERRLCYVALTRAGEKLYLSWASGRSRGRQAQPSRFLMEIEEYGREQSRGQ
jgi:DNA helicase-2/ATP-dependent DNA helicase PcrA